MTSVLALLSAPLRMAGAFSPVARRHAVSTTACFMSSSTGPMPYDDDKMPFYALGTNLAMQVGGQGNFKNMLEEDELDVVLEAFCDNLRGTNTQDPRVVLTTVRPCIPRWQGPDSRQPGRALRHECLLYRRNRCQVPSPAESGRYSLRQIMRGAAFSVISTGVLRTPEGNAVQDRPSLLGLAPVPPV